MANVELQDISNNSSEFRITFSERLPILDTPIDKTGPESKIENIAVSQGALHIRVRSVDPTESAEVIKGFLKNFDFKAKSVKEWLEAFRNLLVEERVEVEEAYS